MCVCVCSRVHVNVRVKTQREDTTKCFPAAAADCYLELQQYALDSPENI